MPNLHSGMPLRRQRHCTTPITSALKSTPLDVVATPGSGPCGLDQSLFDFIAYLLLLAQTSLSDLHLQQLWIQNLRLPEIHGLAKCCFVKVRSKLRCTYRFNFLEKGKQDSCVRVRFGCRQHDDFSNLVVNLRRFLEIS